MENLLVLLDKIQHISPIPVFSKETIVVQNAGMQHWLNLALAEQRGISMNIDYALPAQFLWKLLRTMASEDKVPEQSPFSREVLTWRICELLASENVVNNDDFTPANQYWQDVVTEGVKEYSGKQQAELKRYQLACQLADLFEQYLIFRPEWIDTWHQGKTLSSDQSSNEANAFQDTAQWQGKLWYLLTRDQAYNPVSLLQDAIANIEAKKSLLPPRISFFGINAMAPMWLSFINALSNYTV
jgi:exodeoxyribonuclease V gamma subunit